MNKTPTPARTAGACSCGAPGLLRRLPYCAGRQACPRYQFAPGAIQSFRRHRRLAGWAAVLLEGATVLGLGLLLGVASGYFSAKGWL